MKKLNPLSKSFVTIAALMAVCIQPVFAGNDTWTGGDYGTSTGWSDANNWSPAATPVSGDFLFFDLTTGLSPVDNLGNNLLIGNLQFNSTAGAFSLTASGGSTLTLTNANDPAAGGSGEITGGGFSSSSANNQTVNIPATLLPGAHFIVNSGAGALNLQGAMTRNTGGLLIFTNPGAGLINVTGSGLANNSGGIVPNAFFGTGATTNWAALDGSGNVIAPTYTSLTGTPTLPAGDNHTVNYKEIADTGDMTVGSGAIINSLLIDDTGGNRNIKVTDTLKFSPGGGIFKTAYAAKNGTVSTGTSISVNGGGELVLADGPFDAHGNGLTVNIPIIDDTTPVTVDVMGYVALGGANSYSGGTYISCGRVQAGTATAFGTGPVYIFPGGQAYDNNSSTWTNKFFIAGFGTAESAGIGAIRLNGKTISGATGGTMTLVANASITSGGTVSEVITGPGGLTLGGGAQNGTLTVGSANGPNTYAGDTTIVGKGASGAVGLKMAVANIMPNANANASETGNLILNAQSATVTATFDLNGFSQTINGLNDSGAASQANDFVNNSVSGTPTLTLGYNNATSTFGGIIENTAGTLSINKVGAGTQTLTGVNTYTGTTTVSGGTLLIGSGGSLAAASTVSVGAGALGGVGTINGNVATTSASAQINQENNYLATGNNYGTLAIGGNLDLSGGGAAYLDVGSVYTGPNDEVTVGGTLTLGNQTVIHIKAQTGGGPLDLTGAYTLIHAVGGIVGGSVSSTPVWDGTPPSNSGSYLVLVSGRNVVLSPPLFLVLGATATPSSVTRGNSALLSVTVTNGTAPYTVTVNASSIGGSSTLGLVQDTSQLPASVFTNTTPVLSSSLAAGTYTLPVSANDSATPTPATATANIALTLVGSPLTWVGDGVNNYWTIIYALPGSQDWLNDNTHSADYFYNGDFVTFDDSGSATPAVNLEGAMSPGSILMTNDSENYTISGTGYLAGTGSLTVGGAGTVTLTETGVDSFSGGILVSNGTLVIDNNPTNTISGGMVISNNATVQVGNNDANGATPAGSMTDNGTLNLDRNDTALIVTNLIFGAGAINVNGSGTVTLSNSAAGDPITGPVTVNSGTLALTGPNGTASTISGASLLTINNGGTVELLTDNSLGNPTTVKGLSILINAGGTLTGLGSAGGGTGTSSHLRGLLTLNGGTLAMNGTESPSHGSWNFDSNVVVLASSTTSTITASNVVPTEAGGTVFNIASGTTPSGIDLLVTGSISNAPSTHDSGMIKTGAGKMDLDCGVNGFTNFLTISNGVLQVGTSGDTAVLASPLGSAAGGGSVSNFATINFASSQGANVARVITGTGTVVVNSGVNTFTAANTYTGSTIITNTGTLTLTGSGSISGSTNLSIAAGGTFDVSALASYTMSASKTLNASGTGVIPGSTAAVINGPSAGTVSLGAQPINLTFTPTAFAGDSTHPSFEVLQSALTLNNNTFTINNAAGTPLGAGTYTVALVTGGTINQNATPSYPVTVTGTGLAANMGAYIQVSGGNVNLVVASAVPTAGSPTYYRANGTSLKISVTNLMSNASDPANNPLGLSSVAGGLLTNDMVIATTGNGTSIYYDPSYNGSAYLILTPVNNNNENFSYTVTNTVYGNLSATGTIFIVVTNAVGQPTGQITVSGNSVTTTWAGVVGDDYYVQRNTNLLSGAGWVNIWTTNNVPGVFNFTDTFPDIANPPPSQAYYRLQSAP